MLNERRRRVLVALVEEYIASAQPVGSKTLVDRYELGCSPATVRNELAILEETGFVVQPHVSAGRLPTDIGYRDFVDRLLETSTSAERTPEPAAIPRATELDELMRETSALLTRLTDSLAVILAPSVSLSRVKRINLVALTADRALFVLITESGQILNRYFDLPAEVDAEHLPRIEAALNEAFVGKRAAEIIPLRARSTEPAGSEATVDPLLAPLSGAVGDSGIVDSILADIVEVLEEADRDRLFHVGVPALLAQPEFHDADRARPLIECVEDGLALLDALSSAFENPGVTVRIGHENTRAELGGMSVVAIHYGTGDSDGVLGVIGPTRMDYRRAIDAVSAVADGLSVALS